MTVRIAVVCLAIVFTPRVAAAQIGWWDWLEELSGPGPFPRPGPTVDWRVLCRHEATVGGKVTSAWASNLTPRPLNPGEKSPERQELGHRFFPCASRPGYQNDPTQVRVADYLEVRYGSVSTDEQPLFNDVNELMGKTTARTVQASFMRQLRGFSVGAGTGVIWFTGSALDKTPVRPTITPIIGIIKPLELIAGTERFGDFVAIRIEMIGMLRGLKAADFNSTSTSTFSSGAEFLFSRSVSFNFAVAFR